MNPSNYPQRVAMWFFLLLSLTWLTACATAQVANRGSGGIRGIESGQSPAERYGINPVSLRVSAAGNLLDFRYRVMDPEKAREITARAAKPFLVDRATGIRLTVPTMAYVGALRQSAALPEKGKVYFVLFGNPGRAVKAGSVVDIVFGDAQIKDVSVQ